MKPVVSSVHHAAQDSLADNQLPEEFPRLPGKRLVLSSLRKLVIGAPVVQIVRDNLVSIKPSPCEPWSVDVGQRQGSLRRGPALGDATDHHGASIQHLKSRSCNRSTAQSFEAHRDVLEMTFTCLTVPLKYCLGAGAAGVALSVCSCAAILQGNQISMREIKSEIGQKMFKRYSE